MMNTAVLALQQEAPGAADLARLRIHATMDMVDQAG